MKILILSLCLAIVSCGGDAEPVKETAATESAFDPLLENIDKAEALEQQLMDQKDQLDRAIQDAEAGNSGSEDDAED